VGLKEHQGETIKAVFLEEGQTKVIRGRLVSVGDVFLEIETADGAVFWINQKDIIKIGMEPNRGGGYRGRY